MRLLRHFVPGTDLNLETVKRILTQLEDQNKVNQVSNSTAIGNMPAQEATEQAEPREDALGKMPDCGDDSILLEDTAPMIIDPLGKHSQCSPSFSH